MNILIFDTETTSLEKPFCYDIGFCIYSTEQDKIIYRNEFIIEQIWHNLPLFATAYYSDKRPIYINRMRSRKITMHKYGWVMQKLKYLFKSFNIHYVYAYNSSFDEKVINFNCDWFKTENPFETVKIADIRGYAHKYICFTPSYQEWAKKHNAFTDSGNFSSTAENVYRFVSGKNDFDEEHTALSDSEIELDILRYCILEGATLDGNYTAYRSIPYHEKRILTVTDKDSNITTYEYQKIKINKAKTGIWLE